MTPYESDATKGAAAAPLAKRAVSTVTTRTRNADPPIVAKHAVCISLNGMACRDADTSPSQAVGMAVRKGDLVELTPPGRDRTHLGLPEPAVFRAAFDDPTPEQVRDAIRSEAENEARQQWIGALNELVQELEP